MGWDIGGGAKADDLAAMHRIARICALWTLAVAAVVIVVRILRFEHRWFVLTGAALLQVVLHGLFGMSYLLAGLIAVGLATSAIIVSYLTNSRGNQRTAG